MENREIILAIVLAGLPGAITFIGNIFGLFSARTAQKADVAEKVVGSALQMFNELQEQYRQLRTDFNELVKAHNQLQIRFEILRRGSLANIDLMRENNIEPVYIPPVDWEHE